MTKVKTIIKKTKNVERSEVFLNQVNLRGNNILDNDDNNEFFIGLGMMGFEPETLRLPVRRGNRCATPLLIETISTEEVENEAFFDDFEGNTIAAFSPSMIERSLRFDDRDCEFS